MKNTAIYIGADPLTFNDIDLINKSIDIFGFVHIILDRKNRDAEYSRYYLNYSDRSNIIKHDLAERKILNYKIIPVDSTVLKVLIDNSISNLVLNFDYQKNSNFKMFNMIQLVCPLINIVLLRADNFVDNHFMKTLLDYDQSMAIYKKYCSDFAYSLFKIRNTKKFGLTGNFCGNTDIIISTAREHGYVVLDVDEYVFSLFENKTFILRILKEMHKSGFDSNRLFNSAKLTALDKCSIVKVCLEDDSIYNIFEKYIYEYINTEIAKTLTSNYNDAIVIHFSMIFEFAMEKMFDHILCVKTSEDVLRSNLRNKGYSFDAIDDIISIQLSIQEKSSYADYTLDGNLPECQLKSNMVRFINSILKLNI